MFLCSSNVTRLGVKGALYLASGTPKKAIIIVSLYAYADSDVTNDYKYNIES